MSLLNKNTLNNIEINFKNKKDINNFIEDNIDIASTFFNFTFNKIYSYKEFDNKLRSMLILASMVANNEIEPYKLYLEYFSNVLKVNEIYCILFQAIPYCGFNQVYGLIKTTNEFLKLKR